MNCPACKIAMITLELAEVEIDHCVNCGGIWLDAGELEILMDDPKRPDACWPPFMRPPPVLSRRANALSATRTWPALPWDRRCRRW